MITIKADYKELLSVEEKLKTESENFDYKNLIILSSVISAAVCLSSLVTSIFVNKILKNKYDKKN